MRITESQLRNVVKRVVNEITTDTIDSAREKSLVKLGRANAKYLSTDPRIEKAKKQHERFKNVIDDIENGDNVAKKARLYTNRDKRKKRERIFKDGKWQDVKESVNSRIRMTESDLHHIVKESVKRILREGGIYGREADEYFGKEYEDDPFEFPFTEKGKMFRDGEEKHFERERARRMGNDPLSTNPVDDITRTYPEADDKDKAFARHDRLDDLRHQTDSMGVDTSFRRPNLYDNIVDDWDD